MMAEPPSPSDAAIRSSGGWMITYANRAARRALGYDDGTFSGGSSCEALSQCIDIDLEVESALQVW